MKRQSFVLVAASAIMVLSFQNFIPLSVPLSSLGVDGFEIGGSNYTMSDISVYPWYPSSAFRPLVLRPVLGTYHLDPARVLAQLMSMRQNGQEKIALVIWHAPFAAGIGYDGVYGHVIDSKNGRLLPQHEKNLKDLLTRIVEVGFNEVQIRFASQGGADPGTWPAGEWSDDTERRYQQNWNFVAQTHIVVESHLARKPIRRVYDLGGELAGDVRGQSEKYVRRLWSDYLSSFGATDTYGFSVAPAPGRLARYIDNLRQTGVLPASYAFDVYDLPGNSAFSQLQFLADELRAAGEIGKSILIQESYYNDRESYQQFLRAKETLNLRIRSIMQWNNVRGNQVHFSMDYAKEYSEYNPRPQVLRLRSPAEVCTIPAGQSLCSADIFWDLIHAETVNIKVGGALFASAASSGVQRAEWLTSGKTTFFLEDLSGSRVSSLDIFAVPTTGKIATISLTNTCKLSQSGRCSVQVYWGVTGGPQNKTLVKANGKVFASSGATGLATAPWITSKPVTFELLGSDGVTILDRLIVVGVP